MRLRTKLLGGILFTLLAQIAVTGTFTLLSFLHTTRTAMESDLRTDWDRAKTYIDELKHQLYTDAFQLRLFLQMGQASQASVESLRGSIRSFLSLTSTDRIVVIDDPGLVVADERAGVDPTDQLPFSFLNPRDFRFPRNQFIASPAPGGGTHLFLVTGTTFPSDGRMRHLYLVTSVDRSLTESILLKTGTDLALFVGETPVAASAEVQPFKAEGVSGPRTMSFGGRPYSVYSRPLSSDLPQTLYMVSFRSLLSQRIYVRSVLLSYITAFLITLVASLFLAAGMTSLAVSPFSRLSQWLHRYMDTGEVRPLDIRSRDDVGFLAGAFHGMVSSLISEKRVIGEQLDQISLLHASNERIMNSIRAGILVTDSLGRIESCNGYLLELLGASPDSLVGRPVQEVLEGSFTLRGGAAAAQALAREALARDGDAVVEGLQLARPGDRQLAFTAKISPIVLCGSRKGSLIVLEDVTESERLWAKMTVADKVTSLGILSAGMAHEINNPLGSILSHVNYLKAVERERDKLDSLSWIESETNRIAAIIQRIRAYSAPALDADPCADLNRAASDTVEVLRFTLEKRRLRLALDLAPELPPIVCPPDELKQVVLNILLNACDACPNGGSIQISTDRVAGDRSAERALLSISDDGAGIEPSAMKNIFDPFFTTKLSSHSNGLGLSICYAIVKRVDGDIRVDSVPGKGTKVEVWFHVHERAHRR